MKPFAFSNAFICIVHDIVASKTQTGQAKGLPALRDMDCEDMLTHTLETAKQEGYYLPKRKTKTIPVQFGPE